MGKLPETALNVRIHSGNIQNPIDASYTRTRIHVHIATSSHENASYKQDIHLDLKELPCDMDPQKLYVSSSGIQL